MRFNDYHKQLCAALRLDEDLCRRYRTYMIRCYSRGVTQVACLALLKLEPDIKHFLAEREKQTPTPPEAA